MSYRIIESVFPANVVANGTMTVSYPKGCDAGTFAGAVGHTMMAGGVLLEVPFSVELSFGATDITVRNMSGCTWFASSPFYLELQMVGRFSGVPEINRTVSATVVYANLGSPDAADADGVATSQSVAAAEKALMNGALVKNGVALFDCPRHVVAAWTGGAILTVRGFDEYHQAVTESSASGTSFSGKKAFKKLMSVSFSAAVTGVTVGTGCVLGLPFFLPDTAHVIREIENEGVAVAGTLVKGDRLKSSAATGDVRGTYLPSAILDGARSFRVIVVLPDPDYRGLKQFGG